MPDNIQEILRVKVAHFDPVTLTLVGQGVYPALSLTLPRVRNTEYDKALIEAQDSLRAAQLKPQPVPRFAIPAVIYHILSACQSCCIHSQLAMHRILSELQLKSILGRQHVSYSSGQ